MLISFSFGFSRQVCAEELGVTSRLAWGCAGRVLGKIASDERTRHHAA
jgi:hypothetical protein